MNIISRKQMKADLEAYSVEVCAKRWGIGLRQAYNLAKELMPGRKRIARYRPETLRKFSAIPVWPEMVSQSALRLWNLPSELLLCQSGGLIAWISQKAKDEFLAEHKGERK